MKSQQATVLRAGCLVRVGYDAFCSYCLSESSLLLGDQPLTPTAKEGAYFSYIFHIWRRGHIFLAWMTHGSWDGVL